MEKWDCTGGLQRQVDRTKLFDYNFCDDYDGCSISEIECEYFDHYMEGKHSTRIQHSKHIGVFTDLMHDMQKQVFDKLYNNYGEEVPCGCGTKGPKLINESKSTYHLCQGIRMVKKCLIKPPRLLMIEQSRRAWDIQSTVTRQSKLTSLEKIEHQLVIRDKRYLLVQVMLSNISHFCGVTLINGKYLLYDGMRGKRLEWIAPSKTFDSLGGYFVEALWYAGIEAALVK